METSIYDLAMDFQGKTPRNYQDTSKPLNVRDSKREKTMQDMSELNYLLDLQKEISKKQKY